ncbi:MAG: LapA family protein [Proteobacteria bacterium]|nr:LapA family protein [Pseudomonadota bacterium]
MLRIIRLVLLMLIAVVGLVFAVLNAGQVDLSYYLGVWRAPLSLILVLAFALGALFGVIACLGMLFKAKQEGRRLHKTLKLSEQEVTNLRNIPVRDRH